MKRLDKGDHVVTPTGDLAVVRAVLPGGMLELEYEHALVRNHAGLQLKEKLCRKYVPGLRMPNPVRLKRA